MLAKTKKKLKEASNTIDRAEVRSRAIERKLRDVQKISQAGTSELIAGSDLQETFDVKNNKTDT